MTTFTTLTEPAGWGPHPIRPGSDGLDPTPVDDLESWHAGYDPGGPIDQLIEKHFGAEATCPIPDCIRKDHAVFELCEDAVGHTWFQGDMPIDPVGGIQL